MALRPATSSLYGAGFFTLFGFEQPDGDDLAFPLQSIVGVSSLRRRRQIDVEMPLQDVGDVGIAAAEPRHFERLDIE